jgi:hypothetical protein
VAAQFLLWRITMSSDPLGDIAEVFSAPIESVIVALGRGIAEAQRELDRSSIRFQEEIDADPALSGLGLQSTWYQFPKVDLQLKIAMSVVKSPTTQRAPNRLAPTLLSAPIFATRIALQPVSAAYQNNFNYNTEASSVITLSIVPVPPPRGGDQATVPPRLSAEEVQRTALGTGIFKTASDPSGNTIPDPTRRFDVNFNAAARLWYVLQYDPLDSSVRAVVVAIDDQTGLPHVIST